MAKFLLMVLFTGALLSCNNDGGSDEVNVEYNPDSPATQYRGIQNVNGNIPDSNAYGAEPRANSADSGDINN